MRLNAPRSAHPEDLMHSISSRSPHRQGRPQERHRAVSIGLFLLSLLAIAKPVSGAEGWASLADWLQVDTASGSIVIPQSDPKERGKPTPEWATVGLLLDQEDEGSHRLSSEQTRPGLIELSPDSPKVTGTSHVFEGILKTHDELKSFVFKETLTRVSATETSLSVSLSSLLPIAQKKLCLNILLNKQFKGREIYFDGIPVMLPEEFGESCLFYTRPQKGAQSILIPGLNGKLKIEGKDLNLLFCQYPNGYGSIRLYLSPPDTEVMQAQLQVSLRFESYDVKPVAIAGSANMAFKDEVRDDEKGGWTDQGPQNDLSSLPTGSQVFGNVRFEIIDPAKNQDRSCLVFANPQRQYFPRSANIQMKGEMFSYLYLLHATAWTPRETGAVCGTVEVEYKDRTHQKFEIQTNRDVGDWWNPFSHDNAAVVWKDKNKSNVDVGLYLSRFKIEHREIVRIKLTTTEKAVWMVAGISGVKEDLVPALPKNNDVEVTYTTEPDRNWKMFTFTKDTLKGSCLDFSFLQDAPAGKYGPVIIKDGKFVFKDRPGTPVKFFGANLNGDIVTGLTKQQCETIASRMAAAGYNAVRFHHFDDSLVKTGATSPELDEERLDKMDYLLYCLKQKGIYLVTDLYISRLKGFGREFKDLTEVKYAAIFLPEIRANLKQFSERLLNHVSPYTKLALKDEPALATLSIINEDALTTHFILNVFRQNPYLNEAFEDSYRTWCNEKQMQMPSNPASDPQLLTRFFADKQTEVYEDLASHLRSIGVSHPLTDMNHYTMLVTTLPRDRYDFVENHQYHDHPDYVGEPFKSATINHDQSAIGKLGDLLRDGAPRVFGKPFTITEWNFCYPNRHRSESGAIMGSYAGLQDWDGIFRFEYASQSGPQSAPAFENVHTWAFNTSCDPIQLLSERMAALFFLRGDVIPAKTKISFAVTPEVWKLPFVPDYLYWESRTNGMFPSNFNELGTYAQIGSHLVSSKTKTLPANAAVTFESLPSLNGILPVFSAQSDFVAGLEKEHLVDPAAFVPQKGIFRSESGQIEANSATTSFKVITPKSECLIQSDASQAGVALNVNANTTFSSVFAGSVDGAELVSSRRILVLHLTDLRNSGEKRTEYHGKIIIARGTGKYPLLIKKGSAEITIKNSNPSDPKIWALAVSGERLFEVAFKRTEDRLTFTASTDLGEASPLAYEIAWD